MKLLLFILLVSAPIIAKCEDTRVAAHFLNTPELFEGKKITLDCSKVRRQNAPSNDNDTKIVFFAYTGSHRDGTRGYIMVQVPRDEADKFAKKYGDSVRYESTGNISTRPLSGIFTKGPSNYYVEYTPNT